VLQYGRAPCPSGRRPAGRGKHGIGRWIVLNTLVLYLHGKGGRAEEAQLYEALFPEYDVVGLDYKARTPWEAREELRTFTDRVCRQYASLLLVANSIGAYFAMNAGIDARIRKAFFISPIVDMEKLIRDMMSWAGVTEEDLKEKGVIRTDFGEELSWEYLSYVREHPLRWTAPTEILYGSRDALTSVETVTAFAEAHLAHLTIMDGGEHWFHTREQLRFLESWIRANAGDQAVQAGS